MPIMRGESSNRCGALCVALVRGEGVLELQASVQPAKIARHDLLDRFRLDAELA